MVKNKQGFTLIEVMLAMAVFSIAGVALLGASSSNINNTALLQDKMLSSWVASNQLVQVKLDKKWPLKNNQKGEEELASRIWYWRQEVISTTTETLKVVAIHVSPDKAAKKPTASLMTYLGKD